MFPLLSGREVKAVPIYEYRCRDCGDEFDAIQSFTDRPLRKCKKCGGRLHKLVSECSFQLKGSGWYVTDYGKKDHSNEKKKYDQKKNSKKESKKDSSSAKSSQAAKS